MIVDKPSGKPLSLLAAAAVAFSGALVPGTVLAQEDIECQECHDDVQVRAEPHGEFLECGDCHIGFDMDLHPDEVENPDSAVICGDCHDAAMDLETSPHEILECADCHGPAHDVALVSDNHSPLYPLHQFQTCGTCHEEPAGQEGGYLASVHARALLVSGLADAPTCSTCHGGHDILPPDHPDSMVASGNVPENCGSCHAFILDTWEQSTHGQEWAADNEEAPVCTTCHDAHAVAPPRQAEERLKSPDECGDCHTDQYSTYRDSFHGRATDIGFQTAATCSDCHTSHLNLPSTDPASSIHRDSLQATCGSCHGEVSQAFVTFDPHSDPHSETADPKLRFIYLFMTALLIGVFSFFGLHTVLWLQRSIVGVLRGEITRPPSGDTYVRRFSTTQIRIHLVVIGTFLLLAATGLPLKFHGAPWAAGLAAALGGPDLARILHRVAGIATFGYFLFHLGQLVVWSVVRREKGLFYGWKSMVPEPNDLKELWGNVKYFLYLGPQPKFGRWTYWEKFDYFAVFWGVVIIGTSGLFLWFPVLTTEVLPGWVLNAAYIVHSDEALLAVGFIFVFHFFHTHLRPEAFPLDPVIFTGRMSLERFKEERPNEYQRLLDSGELEERLVGPPSRKELRAGIAGGAVALLIGILLVVAIIWGFLT